MRQTARAVTTVGLSLVLLVSTEGSLLLAPHGAPRRRTNSGGSCG